MSKNRNINTALEKLPSPLRDLLGLKCLMGGLCRSFTFDVLREAHVPPPTGQVWTQASLRAAEHTLHTLGFTDSNNNPVPGLFDEGTRMAETPGVLAALAHAITKKCTGSHRIDPLRLTLRLAVFANNPKAFQTASSQFWNLLDPYDPHDPAIRPLKDQFAEPLPPQWLCSRDPELLIELFSEHSSAWLRGKQVAAFEQELTLICERLETFFPFLFIVQSRTALKVLVLAGQGERLRARAKASELNISLPPAVEGLIACCEGAYEQAITQFLEARKQLRAITGKRTLQLSGVDGLFFALSLLLTRSPKRRDELNKILAAMWKQEDFSTGLQALQALLTLESGEISADADTLEMFTHIDMSPTTPPLDTALLLNAVACIRPKNTSQRAAHGIALFERIRIVPVVARLLAHALARIAPDSAACTAWLAQCSVAAPDIPALLGNTSAWERRLDRLEHLLRGEINTQNATQRLIWLFDPPMHLLAPMVQTPKGAGWTAGRAIALKRLHESGPDQDWLTEQDRRVIATIEWHPNWSGGLRGEFNLPRALHELSGHPLLFHYTTREPLTLSSEETALEVRETAEGYELALSFSAGAYVLEQKTTNNFVYHHIPPALQPVAELLRQEPLLVPKTGMARIMDFVSANAAHLPLRTNLATGTTEPCPRTVIRLQPQGSGLRAEFFVRPFATLTLAPDTPAFPPGRGPVSSMCRVDGRLLGTRRDLAAEKASLALLLEACPTLAAAVDETPGDNTEICLLEPLSEALLTLQELQQATETLPESARPLPEWPQGEQFRVLPQAKAAHLSLRARKAGDWFRLDGELNLSAHDEQRVLDMATLLTRLEQSEGAFIPLGNGEFLALTRQLKRRLERLRRLTEQDRDGSRRIHPLAAGAVDDLLAESAAESHIETDAAWQQRVAQLRAETVPATPPSTLRADLREYQLEGFQWLARLADLGAGACLADDMGLGKTVQTLAVLLNEAANGPCLVVAPMSVCHNWEREAAKFAPTLNIHRLGQTPERTTRAEHILSLGPGDVLIVSYNLLQIEQAALCTPFWRLVVFDEAQALKNPATKRAKAARALRANCRIALSGTPIENQLEDLWSLFHVINPGLLGSLASFRKRFAAAGTRPDPGVESDEADRNPSRQALKTLIRPFILRRTKATVLTELPPRTEQVLAVELPADERALYEALRRKAIQELEGLGGPERDEAGGQRRLLILAELTRLRRACCHPALLDPATPLPGAKLEAFLELARELKQGGHKALVFSQFVGHLHLIRRALELAGCRAGGPAPAPDPALALWTPPGIKPSDDTDETDSTGLGGAFYQYLDGSTPERERQRAVQAFQNGEGDFFLISLKAGGQGLNLTAADFVIHLDPWWNPAVEDQASDRAHRLGQNRPVTIYRLVARNTVEEKILELHHAKRALAADFLSGADAPLSEQELLGLFAE